MGEIVHILPAFNHCTRHIPLHMVQSDNCKTRPNQSSQTLIIPPLITFHPPHQLAGWLSSLPTTDSPQQPHGATSSGCVSQHRCTRQSADTISQCPATTTLRLNNQSKHTDHHAWRVYVHTHSAMFHNNNNCSSLSNRPQSAHQTTTTTTTSACVRDVQVSHPSTVQLTHFAVSCNEHCVHD